MHASPSNTHPAYWADFDQPNARFSKKLITPDALARSLDITRGQLRRMTKAKRLPGQRKTPGNQFRWQDCAQLRKYVVDRLLKKQATSSRTQRRGWARNQTLPPPRNPYKRIDDADQWAIRHLDSVDNPEFARYCLTRWWGLLTFVDRLRAIAATK